MANKQALRELQGRLAERLQAARQQAQAVGWLAVECRGHGLLFPLAEAGEIFPLGPLLAVPHTQPWFAGVANLRGGLHGVIDLGAFLGLAPRPVLPEGARDAAQLVLLNASLGVNCALLVDRLAGLRQRDQMNAAGAPAAPAPAFAGALWTDAGGRAWQEIKLSALAREEHFLAVVR
ncbi:chemotaxis protein CheW [Aquabacterium sp. J223]|uniref:chemotaxis protein CheW n=1 Tax=Aquabacterium sp. J223 TaxID=2898431 RepID=UPI0021ADDF12|nr:chemotaxis protein CheW [Aquabacterium sp. J223]UUX95706.1 chemotaxis protein CheW [Aquabacterium sp. J223]